LLKIKNKYYQSFNSKSNTCVTVDHQYAYRFINTTDINGKIRHYIVYIFKYDEIKQNRNASKDNTGGKYYFLECNS